MILIKDNKKYFAPLALQLVLFGCVDPFEPETINFESAIVVEASITDELKSQVIFLSRTFEFEAEGPAAESNANVEVIDSQGNVFEFVESEAGVYNSVQEFRAEQGSEYNLRIVTNDGRSYSSSSAALPAQTRLDSIYAERIINDDGVEGIGIFADSFDPTGDAQNYRYNYEESFRVIAPDWTPNDLIGDPAGGCNVLEVPREQEEQTCYRTQISANIIQVSTNNLDEDRVERFMVRFINRNDYIISHRYTILVRQIIQSGSSFSYYQTLNDFSSTQSLFSDTQVGFLNGNVFSDQDDTENVLGYFDVVTVDEKRIFFDYEDFFPGEPLPPYVNPCVVNAPELVRGVPPQCVLRTLVETNQVRLIDENAVPQVGEGPYLVVPRVCGDCTVLGSTEIPKFWME